MRDKKFHEKLGLSDEEHKRWHEEHGDPPALTPEEHEFLLRKMGITREEHDAWLKRHGH